MLSARILGTDARAGTPPPGRLSPLGAGGINQMGVCGGWSAAESRHCLRQQAGRLPPGCPEGFVALETSTDRSVARTAHKAEKTQGLEE